MTLKLCILSISLNSFMRRLSRPQPPGLQTEKGLLSTFRWSDPLPENGGSSVGRSPDF
jgi:hypothetical protein